MFLELINDVFMSSSVFYMYFGILIMTIGFGQLFIFHKSNWQTGMDLRLMNHQYMKVDASLFEKPMQVNEPFIIWFVKSFNRIDKLDEDEEDESNSYFTYDFKIRGGRLWKRTLYSQLIGNLVF